MNDNLSVMPGSSSARDMGGIDDESRINNLSVDLSAYCDMKLNDDTYFRKFVEPTWQYEDIRCLVHFEQRVVRDI